MNFKRKKEKIYETIFSTIKSFNSSSIDHELSPSSGGFSINYKFNFHKKDSKSPTMVDPIRNSINLNEKQYSIIYDEIKNKFNLIKQYQNNFSNSKGSKMHKETKKPSIKSIEIAKNQHTNENNNFLKKPTKSLFNISKSLSKSLRQNDETINEWENDLNFKTKISKDLEIFKNSCRVNTLEENINGKINNHNNK
jgi:ATP-dependent Lon protease